MLGNPLNVPVLTTVPTPQMSPAKDAFDFASMFSGGAMMGLK
jgi:hypothetical protein